MGLLRNPLAAVALARIVSGQALPYNPSRILLQRNSSLAYIFEPSQDQQGQSRFLSLDISQTISTSGTPFTTNSDNLPFLEDGRQIPFTPVMDTANGHIVAVTGDCSQGADGIKIYTLSPDEDSESGNGTWKEHESTSEKLGDQGEHAGANYLAAGMAFSGYSNGSFSDSTIYLFGGMCPFANSTTETWAGAANYSNMMLSMTAESTDENSLDYDISQAPGRGPPIAEAGFTITGLPPTFSNANDGNSQYQQQDFVLLGGHTQTAFINMSQVALFSLPQESWTFLSVTQPTGGNTELDAQQVEPRSGHTAVLSEDGSSVIVFGGWVGDVDTPAQPQLAVLRFGVGFGGRGGWTWTVPEQSNSSLGESEGIYGHGATMLPGGIMMIVGGYSIQSGPSEKTRRSSSTFNDKVMLFNTTSNSWIESYKQPVGAAQQEEQKPGALSKNSQKAGLGVGLAFGVLLLVGLIIFYFWYIRKLRRERELHTRLIQSRASDGSFGQPFLEKGGADGQQDGPSVIGDYWQQSRSNEEYPWLQQETDQMGNTTGLFTDKPSPTRGLRKGVPQKNYQYHAAPRYDDKRMSQASGNIHPIAEAEDEDVISRISSRGSGQHMTEAQRQLREVERVLAPQRESQRWSNDPFRDPEPNPLGSHPYTPLERGDTVRRVPTNASLAAAPFKRHSPWDHDGVPNWTIDHHANEPLLVNSNGRSSPSRTDDRTSSTLSEQSQRSTNSSNSMTRTMSTRTGAILAAAAAAAHTITSRSASRSPDRHSFSEEPHIALREAGRRSPHSITRARTNTDPDIMGANGADAESFKTARTSFVQLQAEGEALLGGRRDDPYGRAAAAHARSNTSPVSPTYQPDFVPTALHSRKRPQGLMGSIRRAIGAISTGDSRSFSLTAATASPAQMQYPDRSASSSPNKNRPIVPRRAASDGGHLLRQKRGRKDWQAPAGTWEPYRDSDPDPGDWGPEPSDAQAAEEDWDVENAARQRDVQVMFTVPKTRLRVVNDDMDRASLRSASDGMLSRHSSTRTDAGLKSQGSRNMLRSQGSQNLLGRQNSKGMGRVTSEGNSRWLSDMAEDGEEQRYRD